MKFDILDAEKKLPIKVQNTNHSVSKVPETLLVGWSSFTQTNVFTGAGTQRSKIIEIGRALSLDLGQTEVTI